MKHLKKNSLLSLALLGISVPPQVYSQKPNIIFILTDDQGYGDMACHGNPWIKTPHLDKLHSESVRFTNFHVGTTSAPSRAGLMSGKYCNKVGVWHTINGREMLSEDVETLPELLKEAGYQTGIFGKWHLGDNYSFRPQDREFDEVLIHGGGGVGQQPDYWNNDYLDDTYYMRGTKGSPYDGGHRVPFFIHWPNGGIECGRDISKITSYIDFMPTILDLCGIDISSKKSFDGVSLKPLITENYEEWPERVIFSDTQREEYLVKWKQFAAMTNRWRLIGKDELYDIHEDPDQTNNLASEYPEVVEKLLTAYEDWWQDVSRDADKYNRVKIGTPHENPIRLNSHDLHTTMGYPAWSQSMVRAGNGSNGFWAVEIVNSGAYEIELCRWPKESGLKIRESAPVGDNVPGGKAFMAGKPLNIKTARIKIDKMDEIKKVKEGDFSVLFKVKLEKGKSIIQTWMTDEQGNERPAYYVYIKRK